MRERQKGKPLIGRVGGNQHRLIDSIDSLRDNLKTEIGMERRTVQEIIERAFSQPPNTDEEFFKTKIYGISEDADTGTLHITINEKLHKEILKLFKHQFPDKNFKEYCVPLADEVHMDEIDKKYNNLISEFEERKLEKEK